MLTVTLVATFAAAALWQQWRGVEVERAERTRVQSAWILTGALDWARLILREDRGGSDHLGEPWAIPLQDARLATFLAADKGNTVDTQAENAFLSGQIIDLHSLLNVGNLVTSGSPSEKAMRQFELLFEQLGLPQTELRRMAENLRFAQDIHIDNRNSSQAGLPPQKVEQLVWLGLSLQTVAALQPYVTILPGASTKVNLNTASAEVIYAAAPGLALADAQRLVAERDRSPFAKLGDAAALVGNPQALAADLVDVKSDTFEVRGRLRLDDLVVEERSVVKREGGTIRVVARERGVVDPAALAKLASGRR
ncbi:MAG: type II secretion system minor pseudopilin GspK [Burkholderiales bacterium]|nr:type II secretion system minor pseudopilin GspK [Burkholderiales bacterium]